MARPVLQRILATHTVSDGEQEISLRHPEFPDRLSHVTRSTGELLQRAVAEVRPRVSLEIGLAYGVSTLYICEALAALPQRPVHIVLDPFQHGKWRGIGLKNVQEAGFGDLIEFHAQRSEILLPRLVAEDRRIEFAFVDGLHRFDQALVEFYYINRLLRPGGVVLFDDAVRPSVKRVLCHALTYPSYELYASTGEAPARPTALGALRARAARLRRVRRIVRVDVLTRDGELGLTGRCVGLRKVSEDERPHHWDAEF